MVTVTENPLEPGKEFDNISKNNSGSALFHYAVVKGLADKKRTAGVIIERNGDMEGELSEIEKDIRRRWEIDDVILIRRTGQLQAGDVISLVAVSATASSSAFDACQYGLERIKKMRSIKKTELYMD